MLALAPGRYEIRARKGGQLLEGGLSLARIFGWVFWPLAFAIGVPLADAAAVGALIGTQITQTEFLAYARLAALIQLPPDAGGLSARAAMIATYSLCGFANFGSIGIQLGGIGALVESRRHDLARLGIKAMLAGVLACNMTASIAGALISRPEAELRHAQAIARLAAEKGDLARAAAAYDAVARLHPGTWAAERALREKAALAGAGRTSEEERAP